MYKNTDLHRNFTAAVAAVLVSFAFIGAAVLPAATTLSAPASVQSAHA